MGLTGFVATIFGILLVVLSANGRLQNVVAAIFGQQAPGATPTAAGGSSGGSSWPFNYPGGANLGSLLNWLQSLGTQGAPQGYQDSGGGYYTESGVPFLP